MTTPGTTVLLALDPAHFPTLRDAVQALEPAQTHPANPVLSPRPGHWDATRCKVYGSVLYDPADHLFKMWYSGGADVPDAVQRKEGSPRNIGYAVSADGVRWERPELGLIEHNGSTRNNLIHLDAQAPSVFLFPDEPDPEKRFLLITESGLDTARMKLLHSPDGVRWRRAERGPMHGGDWTGRTHEPFSILFDPLEPDPARRWKGYSLLHVFSGGYRGRAVGFFTAPDPQNWAEWPTQPIMSASDGLESEIHLPHVSRFHDTYVMLYDAMEPNHHTQTELAVSDDGVSFRRVQNGVPVVPNGPPGQPDAGNVCVSPRSLFAHAGRLWWYYTMSADTYQTGPRGFRATPWYRYVGLANWREDGLASLRPAGAGAGEAETAPLQASGDGPIELWLNAACTAREGIVVELLDDRGEVRAAGRPWVGDDLRAAVAWRERAPVLHGGEPFGIRVRLPGSSSRLYALGVSNARRGAAATSPPARPSVRTAAVDGPLRVRWSFRDAGKFSASPLAWRGLVFAGSWDQHLYALDAATGDLRWKHRTANVISTAPAVHGDRVYTGSHDGHVHALEAATGEPRWSAPAAWGRNAGSINGAWVGCSPTVGAYLPRWADEAEAPQRLFIGTHNRDMNALDLQTGAREWSFPTANWVLSRPAVHGHTVYFGSMDGYVYALSARGGALVWRYRVGRHLRYAPTVMPGSVDAEGVCGSPLVHQGAVYIGADDGFLYCLGAAAGEERWAYQTKKWIWARPCVIDDVLIVPSADGCVHGLEAGSGKLLWRVATENANYADAVPHGGLALVACTSGCLYAIEPRGAVAWTFDARSGTRSAPAVGADGTIYLATVGGTVLALVRE